MSSRQASGETALVSGLLAVLTVAAAIAAAINFQQQGRYHLPDDGVTWVDRGSDVLNQQKERFRSAYEAGRQAYNETTSATVEPPKNI